MHDLIPFATRQLDSQSVNTVNARDLHGYLGVTKDYTSWLKVQIKRANLIENTDFIIFTLLGENPKVGRPQVDHHLTFDAAKHVAMMSSADKGHEVRAWFIAKEKELAGVQSSHPKLRDPAMQVLLDVVVQLDEARALATEAKAEAVTASANAHRALATQQFFTVAEYVAFERIDRKVQRSEYRAISDHLRLYCMDRNIPFRTIPVGGKAWKDEYGFHVSVYAEAFTGWLKRRDAQPTLHAIRAT